MISKKTTLRKKFQTLHSSRLIININVIARKLYLNVLSCLTKKSTLVLCVSFFVCVIFVLSLFWAGYSASFVKHAAAQENPFITSENIESISYTSEQEYIREFGVSINILPSGEMSIFERIEYDFGATPKRGIYRTIPTRYESSFWNRRFIQIDVLEVRRDGDLEPYTIRSKRGEILIRIGDPETYLSGTEVYEVLYIVRGGLTFFETYDKFLWNVTPFDTTVPIERSFASIALPVHPQDTEARVSCFEGVVGSIDQCDIQQDEKSFLFASRQAYNQGEGLTLEIEFKKGIVKEPQDFAGILGYLGWYWPVFIPFTIFILIFFIWKRYGKDYPLEPVIALYEPPANISPLMVGTIIDRKLELRDIAGGIVHLAEQGYISLNIIQPKGVLGSLDIMLVLKKSVESIPFPYEKELLIAIFDGNTHVGDSIVYSEVLEAPSVLARMKKVKSMVTKKLFDDGYYHSMSEVIGFVMIAVAQCIFALLFFLPMSPIGVLSVALSGILIFGFSFFMNKPTSKGTEIIRHIKGFKMFLATIEKERYKFFNPPERTPEQFMHYLPYAISFGVADEWTQLFVNTPMSSPSWYSSSDEFSVTSMSHMLSGEMPGFFVHQRANFSFSSNGGSSSSGGGRSGGSVGSW